jgi:hypothetical protein
MPLDFSSTSAFRNELLRRNLRTPYGSTSTTLPINYTDSNYQYKNPSNYGVIPSEKIADRRAEDVLTAEFKNAYTPIFPYVFPTLPSISIVLNRRGIYTLFTEHYKYNEFLGREADMDKGYDDFTGGFTWRSKSIKNEVKPNNNSQFENSLSTNYSFRDDSILNLTQQILNATPKGAAGRGFAGNAIDQTSRIFNDGKKMISKGSAIKFVDKFNGTESGAEYARVWTKDRPYASYGDTMKKKGNIRKFNESILDSPFNLNIAPQNGSQNFDGSTNIQRQGDGFYAKKYMFSLENLAWKSSSRYGYRYEDLPFCERGPNGGRVMWFPPYALTVNENSSGKWNDNNFLGRVEPVYTYQGAERGANMSFKVVVDHPSVLNVLVRKKFSKMSDAEADNYIQAFFVGAVDVDIYDLARQYTTLDRDDISRILAYLNGNKPSVEMFKAYKTVVNPVTENVVISTGGYSQSFKKPYVYFKPNSDQLFAESDEATYTSQFQAAALSAGITTGETATLNSELVSAYIGNSAARNDLDSVIGEVKTNLADGNQAVINIDAGYSAHESNISKARIASLKKYILDKLGISYEDKKVFEVPYKDKEVTKTTQLTFIENDLGINHHNNTGEPCTSPSIDIKGHFNPLLIESISNTFYCRTAKIYASYTKRNMIADAATANLPGKEETVEETFSVVQPSVPALDEVKRILMKLISESYYFDALKEDTPHVFASMKEKLKYFHPAFHSTTPEGLNSRLTFLHQCTRPGDTIPVVQVDGQRTVTDARNTTFGAPPICILRIGDFYHTKVIIRDVQISFEDNVWDMNPEGIGYQPMIADVNISMSFIGGHGLKEPVAELQNALSSNFYANTEMYDNRATPTEDREKFNKEFLQQLLESSDSIRKGDITYPKHSIYGDPIGKYKSHDINSSGQTYGVLQYDSVINDTINALNTYAKVSLDYYNNLYKKWGKTVTSMVLAQANRKYYTGSFVSTTMQIMGVHTGMGSQPQALVDSIANDVRDLNFDVFVKIKNLLTTSQYNMFKDAYLNNFIENFKLELANDINLDFNNGENKLFDNQKSLVGLIDRINLVNQKEDGVVTQEKTQQFTLSAATINIMSQFFSQHIGGFNTMISDMQAKLTNQSVGSITEDPTWRVNILTTYFNDARINAFMALFDGVGDAKTKKIKEILKDYLKAKEATVVGPKTIIVINKSVEYSFMEDLSAPDKTTIAKVFTSGNASVGGTYNYSNLT